ncbi:hypothetical protein U9M48_041212 [Paspalum notatum var. saurae]|uniref:Uncharacterized protein n=1 Tax=Paspalum notatum var. saurae TaxID=547442 RepID=A0AAQ3UPV4_PASNO
MARRSHSASSSNPAPGFQGFPSFDDFRDEAGSCLSRHAPRVAEFHAPLPLPLADEPVAAQDPHRPRLPEILAKDCARMVVAWEQATNEFDAAFGKIENMVHAFPASLGDLRRRYRTPAAMAVGAYYRPSHSRFLYDNVLEMEKVIDLAAYHFLKASGCPLKDIATEARSVYPKNVTGNMKDTEFVFRMFRDGCFLLQYMLMYTDRHKVHPSLLSYLSSNQAIISRDIMLLENQIPWFLYVDVEEFVAKMGRTLQVRRDSQARTPFMLGDYRPPHLLGLLHHYKTLNEMGIKLTASKTTKFIDMGVKKKLLSCEISFPPLLLDEMRSCWLINMAAFEVCIGAGTGARDDIGPAVVCSYLALLAMLMDREEDVHELRAKRLVQGELTNKETLDFFKNLIKHISGGTHYLRILEEIEDYKCKRWMWIKVHSFVYKNLKTIITVLSIIGVVFGIFKTLLSLKTH